MKTTLTRQEKEALLAQQDPKYATELHGTTLDETYISNMIALYAESSGIRKKIDPESLHESSVTEESPRNV